MVQVGNSNSNLFRRFVSLQLYVHFPAVYVDANEFTRTGPRAERKVI